MEVVKAFLKEGGLPPDVRVSDDGVTLPPGCVLASPLGISCTPWVFQSPLGISFTPWVFQFTSGCLTNAIVSQIKLINQAAGEDTTFSPIYTVSEGHCVGATHTYLDIFTNTIVITYIEARTSVAVSVCTH